MKLTSVKLSALSLMALAMTACTSNEEVAMPQSESNQIGFKVVTNNLTRASNSYCSTNLPARIKVTAYNNGKNYYGDAFDEISKSNEEGSVTWTGTTDRYWPRVDDDSWQGLTFYAFVEDDYYENGSETKISISDKIKLSETNSSSSESATSNVDVTSPSVMDFTVNSDVSKQMDLMYATTANRTNTGAVPLNFRHALSQVCFKAQNLDPRIKSLVINKIEIHGLTSRGDYQFPVSSTLVTATSTHNATEVPTGAGAKGSWTLSEESDYTNKTFLIENLEKDVPLSTQTDDPAVNISVPDLTTSNPYENALNLIPQTVSPMVTEGDGGAYFKINVTMKVSERSDVSETTKQELESLEAKTKDIIVPVDIAWEEGNRYIYTFIWEDNGHVTYQARFADFDNVEKPTPAEPKNVIKGTANSGESFKISVNGNYNVTVTPTESEKDGVYKFSVYCGDEIKSIRFDGCTTITTLDLSSLDTSGVTDMKGMFENCLNLSSLNLSGFDTSNVTDMSYMFSTLNLESLDLSDFDTSKVTDMSYMFGGSNCLISLDLSGFDTSNVTDMSGMFIYCQSMLSLDLSDFNTSNVQYMTNMFTQCNYLEWLDLSGFDTSSVTGMKEMFYNCYSLTSLDLLNFDTSNVTYVDDMSNMFYSCSALTSITTNSNFKDWADTNSSTISLSDLPSDVIWDIQ